MKKPSKSFEIALSAMACAVAAVALTVGTYVDFLLAAGFIIAVYALMIPLAKGFVWGGALAYAGASLLAFVFNIGGIFKLLPFIIFLGLHPVLNFLQKKFIHRKILHGVAFLIKALWFDGMLLFVWFVLGPVFGINEISFYDVLVEYLWYIVFFGGTVFFAVYDYLIFLCQRSADLLVRRIRR